MKSSFSFRVVGVFIIVAALAALFLFAFPVFVSSCDSRITRADGGGTPPVLNDGAKGGQEWRGKPFDLSAVKAEIESAEIPDGADEAVWDALQIAFIIELERELERRNADGGTPPVLEGSGGAAYGGYADASERKIAAVPKQDAGRVDDFKFDSATGLISWTYKNLGD